MTDDERPTGRPDDGALGRFLRDEVPGPGPGYWDAIDARLAAVENEGGPAESHEAEETDVGPDTDAEVIRLTDMTARRSQRFSPSILLGAAAAIVVLLGLGVALTRGSDDIETQIATDGNAEMTDPDSTDDDDAADATNDGDDGDSEPTASVPAAIRYCYAGGELGEGVVSYADLSAPIGENPSVRIASRVELGDQTFYEVVDGTVGPDGSVEGTYVNLTDGNRFPAMFVSVDPDGLSLADDVFVEPADCGDLADDLADIETNVAALEATPRTTDVEFLPEEEPSAWAVQANGPVLARIAPGLFEEVVRTYEPGAQDLLTNAVIGTGRFATADDLTWVEITGPDDGSSASWWVQADVLTRVESDTSLGEGVIVLSDGEPADFPIPAETPIRPLPGDGAPEVGVVGPDAVARGTGRLAVVDDRFWVELAETDERPVAWILLAQILPPDPARRCYGDELGNVAFVLDWSDDETFRGFIRSTVDGAEVFTIVAGRRSAADPETYDVNVAVDGSTEFTTEPWEIFSGGLASGDTSYATTTCATFTSAEQAAVEARLDNGDFPPLPDPAG